MIELKLTGDCVADVRAHISDLAVYFKGAPTPAPAAVPAAPATAPAVPTAAPAPAVPTTAAPGLTLEQLGKAGADLIAADPGKMPQLMAVLQQLGVPSIQHLQPDQIGPCAIALRGLGAKI